MYGYFLFGTSESPGTHLRQVPAVPAVPAEPVPVAAASVTAGTTRGGSGGFFLDRLAQGTPCYMFFLHGFFNDIIYIYIDIDIWVCIYIYNIVK